jgi:CRP-like cAMP-binding protein
MSMNMIDIMFDGLTAALSRLPHREILDSARTPVFHRRDRVKSVQLVRSGLIHLVRHQEDGSPVILQPATSGSVLAEASVYSARYHCDAGAEVAVVTWAIRRKN